MLPHRAAPLLALLAVASPLAAPAGAVAILLEQDDAGSGRDAPGRFEDGLRLPLGTHRGELLSLPMTGARDPLLDQDDWYRFLLPEGVNASLALQLLPDAQPITAELRRPDGGLAAWVAASEPSVPSWTAWARTDVGGWWAVRVTTRASTGGGYAFTVGAALPLGEGHAASGSGYLAWAAVVPEGATARVRLVGTLGSANDPMREDVFVLRDGALRIWFSDSITGPDGLAVRAAGVLVEAEFRTADGVLRTSSPTVTLSGPGLFHIVVLTRAREAYTFLELLPGSEGVVSLGAERGGPEELRVLRPQDFDALAVAATSFAEASVEARATIEVTHTLLGTFGCPGPLAACAVERPDGTTQHSAFSFLLGGPPGRWGFARGRAAGASFDAFPLFAADVRLPRGP